MEKSLNNGTLSVVFICSFEKDSDLIKPYLNPYLNLASNYVLE